MADNDVIVNLEKEVNENSDVIDSAVTVLNTLNNELKAVKAELAAQGITNERLNALSTKLDERSNALAAAVANTTGA